MVTLFYKMIDLSVCLYMVYIYFLNILMYHFVLWNCIIKLQKGWENTIKV